MIGGTGYEGRIYLANTLTLASIWLDSAGSLAASNPHSPNPGTQTSSTANMLTTDDSITVLSTTGFSVGDLVPIDGSAGRFYGVIRTVTDSTHLRFTQTLAAMGGAATMNSGALVGGPEMTGHFQCFVQDTSDYDFTLKNLATGKEGPPEGVATLSTAGTLIFQEEGVDTSTRPKLNFISPFITLTDNGGSNRGDVTGPTAGVNPTTSAVGDAVAEGVNTTIARSDHKHAREAFATNAILLGTAAAAGAATTLIRSDATIAAFDATAPVTQAFGDAAGAGSIAFAARRDHKHGMPEDPILIGSNYHRFRYEPINLGGVNVVNVGSGTTALLGAGRGQLMSTGATNPSSTSQRVGLVGSGGVLSLVSKIRRLEFTGYISDVFANANAYLYLTEENVDTAPAATSRHLGIKNLNGVVSFTTADGTTEQTTDVTTFVTAATETAFVITFDGTTAKLIINGTVRATHATNVPSGGTLQPQFRAFINNNSTTNARALAFYSADAVFANS